jgi:hypothetical protein
MYCRRASDGANLGDIPTASVSITIRNPNTFAVSPLFTVTGVGANPGGNPAVIGPFDGTTAFTVSAPATLLPDGTYAADVGVYFDVVSFAWGGTLTDTTTSSTLRPGTFGDVLAPTPELWSLALFGAGAAGMASYALTRLRSRRRHSPIDD